MPLNVDDIVGTGLRQVEQIMGAAVLERPAHYQKCWQIFREMGLIWGLCPENAEKMASNMTKWVGDVVELLEGHGDEPVELKLPTVDWNGPAGDTHE